VRNHLHPLVTYDGRGASVQFDAMPRRCPCCGEPDSPWRLAARSTTYDEAIVDFAFQCSRPNCRRVYVATYHRNDQGDYVLAVDAAASWVDQLLTLHS